MSQAGSFNSGGGGGGGTDIRTITGNTGGPEVPDAAHNFNFLTANTTVKFAGSLNTETLDFGITNILLGSSGSAITTASDNVGIGRVSTISLTSGALNSFYGFGSGNAVNTGSSNTGIGAQSLTTLTTGSANTAIGVASLGNLLTGGNNIAVGGSAGSIYAGAEGSNIVIGNEGVLGESHVIRIGTQGNVSGEQNMCFIAGIDSVLPTGTVLPVIINGSGQLGTGSQTTLTAWIDEAISFAALSGFGYFITATLTATLPAFPAQGETIAFAVDSLAGILTIQAAAGQTIQVGTGISTVAGTASSIFDGDSVTLVYRVIGSQWIATSSIGNWTMA
jgi:hypothetical protein